MAEAVDRALAAAMFSLCLAAASSAQQPAADSSKCDSIVFASRVDSVSAGLFVTSVRIDGEMSAGQSVNISMAVAAAFTIPRPLRLSVFAGPIRMTAFRRVADDTATELREPTVTGVYRFWARRQPTVSKAVVVRASLVPGFDSASIEAIIGAQSIRDVMVPEDGDDSIQVDVSISTDSTRNSRRVIGAVFPRMPVVDAVPLRGNPSPAFPESEKRDSSSRGEVVFRFVVDRNGAPAMETIEVTRASSLAFIREALAVLPRQQFKPAMIRGCRVAQVVSYPFAFVVPDAAKSPLRH
ncbi:MAG TPA: energy transducer TonB [Gemmatimonadaceae bacterium]